LTLAVSGGLHDGSQVRLTDFLCFAAGFTGRERSAVVRHITELRHHGVNAPSRVPCCFPILPHLLFAGRDTIEVFGSRTSGEIEPVIVLLDGLPRFVGVGSDHTDRFMEHTSIPHSKQLCPKVMTEIVWDYSLVAEHWDELQLISWSNGRIYRSGTLADLLPVEELIATIPTSRRGSIMILFGGTVPLVGPIDFGSHFAGSLKDPSTGRSLRLSYDVRITQPVD